jgi:hypothetical protein
MGSRIDADEAVEVIFDALDAGLVTAREEHDALNWFRDSPYTERYGQIVNIGGRRFHVTAKEIDAKIPVDRNGLVWP